MHGVHTFVLLKRAVYHVSCPAYENETRSLREQKR